MQLFYSIFNEGDNTSLLDSNESSHLINVLRKKAGDIIFITNGDGLLAECTITIAHAKSTQLAINKIVNKQENQQNYKLHIAIAPTKNMDRMEYFVEKAVEFGIDEISLVICERSERKEIKTERLNKIALSAMKQSGSLFLPKINDAITFKKFIEKYTNILICTCDGERTPIQLLENINHTYLFMIGPEGDFSKTEVTSLLQNTKSVSVDLGKKRLRTETAGIYIAAYLYSKYL